MEELWDCLCRDEETDFSPIFHNSHRKRLFIFHFFSFCHRRNLLKTNFKEKEKSYLFRIAENFSHGEGID